MVYGSLRTPSDLLASDISIKCFGGDKGFYRQDVCTIMNKFFHSVFHSELFYLKMV